MSRSPQDAGKTAATAEAMLYVAQDMSDAPDLPTLQDAVERRMRSGERFDDVEDYIDSLPLPEDQKSALWLLAYSYVDNRRQRDIARGHAVVVAALQGS